VRKPERIALALPTIAMLTAGDLLKAWTPL